MQPSVFTRAKGEIILSSLNKFELRAANNNWNEEEEDLSIALYLDNSSLIYHNSLSEQTKANQQLGKSGLRIQYLSPDK